MWDSLKFRTCTLGWRDGKWKILKHVFENDCRQKRYRKLDMKNFGVFPHCRWGLKAWACCLWHILPYKKRQWITKKNAKIFISFLFHIFSAYRRSQIPNSCVRVIVHILFLNICLYPEIFLKCQCKINAIPLNFCTLE